MEKFRVYLDMFLCKVYEGELKIGENESFETEDKKVSMTITVTGNEEIEVKGYSGLKYSPGLYSFKMYTKFVSLSTFHGYFSFETLKHAGFSKDANVRGFSTFSYNNFMKKDTKRKELLSAASKDNQFCLAISHESEAEDYFELSLLIEVDKIKVDIFTSSVLDKVTIFRNTMELPLISKFTGKDLDDKEYFLSSALELDQYIKMHNIFKG